MQDCMKYSFAERRTNTVKNWEANVRKVVPYVPGEQPKMQNLIKLNTNENPYPPSPKVEEAWKNMNLDTLRRYPDPTVHKLVKSIADNYGLSENQVFVGVGSDDVLAMIFMTFFNSDKPILFPDINYSFYEVWADMLRIPYKKLPLKEDFTIDKEDYFQENGGIIFANPNAPTGIEMPLLYIEEIVQKNPNVIVVVDEAYVDFGAETALPFLEKYDNLLVVQTFSKSRGMAGMRIGYAMGNPALIQYLNEVKHSYNSYTMNQPAIELGVAAMEDKEYFEETLRKVIETREWTKSELHKLGFSFGDSKTNFIFAKHECYPARELFLALRQANILVRYFDKPRIGDYLRISIGTQEEMEQFIHFLKGYTAKQL